MPEELTDFSECFITGTAAEVTPVSEIANWKFTPGNISEQLMADYTAEVQPKGKAAAAQGPASSSAGLSSPLPVGSRRAKLALRVAPRGRGSVMVVELDRGTRLAGAALMMPKIDEAFPAAAPRCTT
jgi:hypothetical protein